MPSPAINEETRLNRLNEYGLLGNKPDKWQVEACHIAKHIAQAKNAAIHLVDKNRQWCLAQTGDMPIEIPRSTSPAGRAIDSAPLIHREELDKEQYTGFLLQDNGLPMGTLSLYTADPIAAETETILALHAGTIMDRIATRNRLNHLESAEGEELFEHVVEGIFRTTPDGRYLTANPMLAHIYGYDSPSDLIQELSDISGQLYVDPSRRNDFVRLMKENDVITNFQSQIRQRNGEVIWISENAHAVRDDDGGILYYEGTVTDVTEKQAIESALRESELLYHSLVETIPQNILRKDLDGRFTFANQNFCRLIGHSLPDIVGKSDHDFFPEDLADKYRRDDLKVIETGEPYDTIEEHETTEGNKIYVHVIKTPLVDSEGNPSGVQGMFWDVTQRKKVEEELAFERDLLRALLENVPDRIYFKDTESRFVRCSRALANRLGLNMPEEAIGKTDYDFHPERDAREYHEDEQRVVLTGESVINKVEKQTGADYQPVWASVTKVPFRNRAGMIKGVIGISRDITALKQAEEEMTRARDLAEESAMLKAQFLATMSHEIRTPMNAIIGMVDLLLSTDLDHEQDEYANHVRMSADALLEILNDILDLSKIEAGRLEVEQTTFNLRELVEDAVELHALKVQEKNVELACHVPTDCAGAHKGDAGRLRQILLNFISNAVKFTDKGTVRVTARRVENGHVRFEVTDTGIGILDELQPKIFEAFRQADGSTTRKYGGTGLGLAISRELVELMDGRLGVESEPDSGSVFWFSLPLTKVDGEPSEALTALKDRSLLIAAPDGFVRRSSEEFMAEWGMETHSVADGGSAEKFLNEQPVPDFILLDLDLPGIDVLDLVQQSRDRSPESHVFLLTTRARKFDPGIIRAMGIAGTLSKPVKCRRLLQSLLGIFSDDSPSKQRLASPHPQQALNILVLEDNRINQRVAQLQLEKLGCKVTLRDGGEAALHEPLDEYDLIFMDCQMPGMDGYEATRKIREMQKSRNDSQKAYIVAMTANTREEDRQACLDAGMDDFISKPVQISELQRIIHEAFDDLEFTGEPAVFSSLPKGTLREILPMFLEQAREHINVLQEKADSNDFETIRQTAHQLKGTSANLGARALAELCGQIEDAARHESGICKDLIPSLPKQLDVAETHFQRLADG